jgi:hypothetical protein
MTQGGGGKGGWAEEREGRAAAVMKGIEWTATLRRRRKSGLSTRSERTKDRGSETEIERGREGREGRERERHRERERQRERERERERESEREGEGEREREGG